jgi:hypothetical protein
MNTSTFLNGSFRVRRLWGYLDGVMAVETVCGSLCYESALSSSMCGGGGFQWFTRHWLVTSAVVPVANQK